MAVSSRVHLIPSSVSRVAVACLAALALAAGDVRAADRTVLAVVTIDSYADVKKQLGWLGMQAGQPGLAGMLESLLLMSTQGRGLAGLDVKRPLGAVVTTDGADVAVGVFVPVKNLDGLLDSLKAVTGPVQRSGDTRSLTLPSGVPLDITERDGWAIVAPRGMDAQGIDPTPLFGTLSEKYSLGIELFPNRLPEPLRVTLRMLIEQAAATAAEQGQQLDGRAIGRALDSLDDTELLALGFAIDADKERVFLENRTVAVAGSPLALAMQGSDKGRLTVAMPRPADGKNAAISAHLVQVVPEAAQREVLGMLDLALPPDSDDPLTKTIAVLLREVISSVLTTGGIDAAAAVDTPREKPRDGGSLPDVTVGVRVKDGAALEKQLKQSLSTGEGRRLLPEGVTMSFDAGKAGKATLHTVAVDLAGSDAAESLGDKVELTLAIAPEYVFLLTGGEPRERVESLLGPDGRVDAAAKPIAGVDVAVDRLLTYAGGRPAAAEGTTESDQPTGLVRLLVRPLERGVATRLSADAAAIRTLATANAEAAGLDPAGGGLPLPNGFPLPAPAR